jgi:hypothetical protein
MGCGISHRNTKHTNTIQIITKIPSKINIRILNYTLHPILFGATKSRKMRWAGHLSQMGKQELNYILVRKHQGVRQRGRPWTALNGISRQIRCEGANWIQLARNRDL